MSESYNPYAPPKNADSLAPSKDEILYDGETLMIPKKFTFPPVCLKTGAVTDLTPPQRRKLAWYPPLLAILLIVNILIFAIVAAIVSKKGEIHYQLSRTIAAKRRNALVRNWVLVGAGIGCGALALTNPNPALILTAVVLILSGLILSLVASRFLWAKRIDKTHIWLGGVPDHVARALAASHGRLV